ncbi:MAG: hypothetical protein O2897_02235 [bacterium]|nr:hypothetical protein [bacterium]
MACYFSATMFNKQKMIIWLKRYGPAEIGGIITMYIGYYAIDYLANLEIAAAFIGAIAETSGFYGTLLVQRFKDKENRKNKLAILGEMITEFGPSELLDSLVLRPICVIYFVNLCGPEIGVLFGKLSSDVLFYVPVIATYEWRNRAANKAKATLNRPLI